MEYTCQKKVADCQKLLHNLMSERLVARAAKPEGEANGFEKTWLTGQ